MLRLVATSKSYVTLQLHGHKPYANMCGPFILLEPADTYMCVSGSSVVSVVPCSQLGIKPIPKPGSHKILEESIPKPMPTSFQLDTSI